MNCLRVLWCKALCDPEWTYDLMPTVGRWIFLRLIPRRLYPRLHHANIEMRTVFLDRAIANATASLPPETNVRIISLGAGYDVRCCRILSCQDSSSRKVEAWELDLPKVVAAKQKLLERLVKRRRKRNETTILPELRGVDLNDVDGTVRPLLQAMEKSPERWHTILVAEGVLIFFRSGVSEQLLRLVRDTSSPATFCFTDQIVSGGRRPDAETFFEKCGWKLEEWCVKPGKAKHMGVARTM